MALLSLIPSVHPSARMAEAVDGGRQELCEAVLHRDNHTCRFCGLPAGNWQDVFHLNDDHHDWTPANLAASCLLCHGVQHIGASAANQDMDVIWLPQIEQPVLNVIVRTIHLLLFKHATPTTLATRYMPEEDEPKAAWRAYAALSARKRDVVQLIDTHQPRDLASALRALSPALYAKRATLLGGLRLLHRGQHWRHGRDRYPDQLALWAQHPSAPQ